MNYQKHYNLLISTRRGLPRKKVKGQNHVYNWHHIVPKCYGGSNNKDNLILLTAREHFVAHWLLWKIYGQKMALAFFRMTHAKQNAQRINSRTYDKLRCDQSEVMRIQNTGYKMPQSQRDAIGAKHKGMKRSIETRINMSNAQRGEKGSRTDKIKYVFLSKEHGLFVGLRCNIIEKYGLDHSSVGMIINGKRKYHRGWVYIGEEKNVNFLETSWLNPELYNLNIKNKPRVDRCKRRSRIPAKLLNKHNQE